MAFWLLKSEPGSWSWVDQVAAGPAGTAWDGVRNHLAQMHLRAMAAGDLAFFYHSNQGRAVVGIVEVAGGLRADPGDVSGRFGLVDVRAAAPFARPVTLDEIRSDPRLAKMVLVTNSRLSVQPVTPEEWKIVSAMGGASPKESRPG